MVAACLLTLATATLGQTTDLQYAATWSAELRTPGRLAASLGGGVYVTDQTGRKIVEFAADGSVSNTWAIPEEPIGIAVGLDGRVFISRRDGAVGIYDAAFVPQGVLDPSPLSFSAPNDMAVHPGTGEVYVADSAAHRVFVFDGNTATLLRAWGVEGSGLGEFQSPQAIAIDAARDLVLVADVDNFRVEVFDTAGILQFKFGYHSIYLPGTELAWFPRSEGLAVDSCGNIYVADAVMGTIRAFSPLGRELNTQFLPVVGYGFGPALLRIPCDLLISGGRLYAVSTNDPAIEVFGLSCSAPQANSVEKLMADGDATPGLPAAVEAILAAPQETKAQSGGFPLQPPHQVDTAYSCGRCHSLDGSPDGGMLTSAGQENICLSCHMPSGRAMNSVVVGGHKGESHPWGVPASSPPGVPGPAPGSELSLHLDNGNIRCGTCHNPHDSAGPDAQYLRATVKDGALCAQCHTEVAEWQHAGHADSHAEAFVHYDWSLPNRAACRKCHSGNGYIDSTKGLPAAQQNGSFRVLDCVVCHSVHGAPQDAELLRTHDSVTIPAVGQDLTLNNLGPSATCYTCHNGRVAPDDGSLTPHYLLGAPMLQGINANSFGETLQSSPHAVLTSCTDCHMAPGPAAGQPGAGKVGGHSFSMKVHDPADPDYGVENVVNACQSCHPGLDTLNRTAHGDYDGDGSIEGVQDETRGLLDLVLAAIQAKGAVQLAGHPYWNVAGVPAADQAAVKNAIWNWQFVINSGDYGVHNTAYAVGALQAAYKGLTGQDVPGAFLRYASPVASLPGTVVQISSVNGGAIVQPGGAFTVNFTVQDDAGNVIPRSALDRLQLYVSGPTSNYQRVIPSDTANFVENPDGSITYSRAAFPGVYAAPLNDSAAFGPADGELTGQALLDGTYTVLIEARRTLNGVRKAGDATFDFVVDADGANPPVLASRQVVTRDACNQCHNDLQLHGGNRFAVSGCVVCHTAGSEDRISNPASTPGLNINFHDMIHRLHSGHALPRVAATANSADPYHYAIRGFSGLIDFSEVGFTVMPSGTLDCAACHEGAAQGGQSYTSITRAKCSTCHDDISFTTGTVLDKSHPSVSGGLLTQADLNDPAYRVFPSGVNHTFPDDSTCSACHGPGANWDVRVMHQHPTHPEQEGTAPAVDILGITGMTGGGGAYFQAGDRPRITFKLRNSTTDPQPLVSGDKSVADRLEVIVIGPTTLYQNIVPAKAFWSNGALAVSASDFLDNGNGTYTYVAPALPANYPAQINSIGKAPADQIYSSAGGWGQQYLPSGKPLDAGTYTVLMYGRRLTPTAGEREPILTDTHDFQFGVGGPAVAYSGTVSNTSCNACHGQLSGHGNQREGVMSCLACHTAGSQNTETGQSIDMRVMVHKLHNARNLPSVQSGGHYELKAHAGLVDFSHLLISAMPGAAAECQVCHTNDDWKSPPVRENMRTWMVACTSCHDGPETAEHVQAGTLSGTFVETCASCHGDGTPWSVERVHKSP